MEMNMVENVLVTGGAGFIGSHLVDALVEQGHSVRVFDNLEPQVHGEKRVEDAWPEYRNPDAEYLLGDVRDRASLSGALEGADVVFHMAAVVGVGQSMYEVERYVDVNVRGTAVLLDILANDALIRDRVRKVIVASSMSVYGEGAYACPDHGNVSPKLRTAAQLQSRDWELHCPVSSNEKVCGLELRPLPTDELSRLSPTSIYAITKRGQEEMVLSVCQAYGIPAVALRYFNAYGARQALSNPYTGVAAIFCSRLLNGHVPAIFEDGMQRRDFVHISDLVQANLLAMQKDEADGRVFNVGSGRVITIRDLADSLSERLNGGKDAEILGQFRDGDVRHCFPDVRQIEGLGYEAQVSLVDGVPELVEWVRSSTAPDDFENMKNELVSRGLVS